MASKAKSTKMQKAAKIKAKKAEKAKKEPTFSLTIGNGGENHTGMEFIGNKRKKGQGWRYSKLMYAKQILEDIFNLTVEIVHLNTLLDGVKIPENKKPEDAWFMIVRNFLATGVHKKFKKELESFVWDSQYWCTRRKKVLNKLARKNVCWGEKGQKADFSNKKGTIIPYSQSPLVLRLKQVVELLMQDEDLIVEGNMYEDPEKNGIGGHGDTERKCVGCLRVGAAMPMKFGWFYKWKMVGKSYKTIINGGDLYFMSEKAVGSDWKSSSIFTLRHAAGAKKYLKFTGENL